MSQMNENHTDVDTEKTIFFKKLKHWVENNSFKNFTTYWEQQNRAIILQKLLVIFSMYRYNIILFPVVRKCPSL